MKNGLQRAHARISQMLERSGFDGGGLAVVSDHSHVRAFRYYDHALQDGGLNIRFCAVSEQNRGQHKARFELDEDVHALRDGEVAFYHDGRLLTVMAVQAMPAP